MDHKDPVNLPPVDWNKWLPRIAIAMAVVFVVALISRARAMMIGAGVLDVGILLALLAVGTYGVLRRYSAPRSKSDDDKS